MQPTNSVLPSPEELPELRTDTAPNMNQVTGADLSNETQLAQAIEQGNSTAQTPPPLDPSFSNNSAAMAAAGLLPDAVPGLSTTKASPHSPDIADDSDLIEKEWVNKAKHIVEQTKEDPYNQTKELNKMKADYLQKRYAKELKLPED